MNKEKNRFRNFISNLFSYQEENDYNFILPERPNELRDSKERIQDEQLEPLEETDQEIDVDLQKNLDYIKVKYNTLINSDIKIREFMINVRNKQYKAFLLFIDGMIDSKSINNFILKPLILKNKANTYDSTQSIISTNNKVSIKKVDDFNLSNYIHDCLIPQNDITEYSNFKDIFPTINAGNCALFIDTLNTGFTMDVKGFSKRSLSTPNNEVVIKGSQEAFIENIRTNTTLLRRIVNNENLIIEDLTVGTVSQTKCAVCYIKNIANSDLVAEVKYRINNLSIDYLISTGQLEQLIEDTSKYSLPQLMSTERPDKAATYLLEGRVVVILNGSPYSLVMPTTLFDLMGSTEDLNLKYQFSNLIKLIRVLAIFITLLLPGIYISITNFHQELIPTELLFAIVASRANVPFPVVFEILVMEISLELIREAGIRVPSPMGQTISIVGALILGDAAVSANIVSPILIIVVAITGIAAFAIPDFSLSFHLRISRFTYILLGAFFGFLGIAVGLFIHFTILCSINSFGVPYLTPYIPVTRKNNGRYFIKPFWKREKRADALNTKRPREQENISMKWRKGGTI